MSGSAALLDRSGRGVIFGPDSASNIDANVGKYLVTTVICRPWAYCGKRASVEDAIRTARGDGRPLTMHIAETLRISVRRSLMKTAPAR